MELPFSEQALVPNAKLLRYLLDSSHPEGRGKAAFFLHLGFHPDRAVQLREALLDTAAETDMEEIVTEHGRKYTGIGPLRTPAGRVVSVRTVWVMIAGAPPPLFVTAYPAPESEDR